MKKIAFVFPGQGAQYVGMGRDFYEQFPESREVFDRAGGLLGMDMKELCFEENDRLDLTEYTQAAMITTIGAMLKKIETMGIRPQVAAGLSLGEYAALVTAGALSLYDAIRLVRLRGQLMQEAVPQGVGGMAAVLGVGQEVVEQACKETEGVVTIANYNCPGQLVISGELAAVEACAEKLKALGAKRVVPLNVSGPFHSPLLKPAGEKLAKELENTEICDRGICKGNGRNPRPACKTDFLVRALAAMRGMYDSRRRGNFCGDWTGKDHLVVYKKD